MNELDIDHVANINRWQYFRRKSSLGEFDIYSEIDSKINHYQRMNFIWIFLTLLFVLPVLFDVFELIISDFFETGVGRSGQLYLDTAFLIMGLFFSSKHFRLLRKLEIWKKRKSYITEFDGQYQKDSQWSS